MVLSLAEQREHQRVRIDDAGRGRQDRRRATDSRLDRGDLRAFEPGQLGVGARGLGMRGDGFEPDGGSNLDATFRSHVLLSFQRPCALRGGASTSA